MICRLISFFYASTFVFSFVHEESKATNKDAWAEERAKRISHTLVSLLENRCKAPTHENRRGVQTSKHDFKRQLE